MSYGEATLLPDYGRFVDLVNEVFSWFLILTRHLYLFFSIFLIIEAFVVLRLGGEQASSDICEQCW
jgi:choline-glycine betaine transporter